MKTILFEGPSRTYLPEIPAYIRYLKQNNPQIRAYSAHDLKEYRPRDFDIIWRFMGLDVKGEGRYLVHEYNSLSTGKAANWKNRVKKLVNARPHRRVFLNKIVRAGFGFNDSVPYGFRDMGIASKFFDVRPRPEYDFVYAGSIHRGPEVLQMLEYFAKTLTGATLLIIGTVNPDIRAQYQPYANITFTGRIHYEDVAEMVAKGRYGLNLVPDIYPYNVQTATKVLEYCALGLPIVSMKYRWAEHFAAHREGNFFWLDKDFSNLTLSAVERFAFVTPDVENRRWRDVIQQSGIFDFLSDL